MWPAPALPLRCWHRWRAPPLSLRDVWAPAARPGSPAAPFTLGRAGSLAETPCRTARGSGASPGQSRRSGSVAGEEGQDLAHGPLSAGGFWQREMLLDLVAVAAAV